MSKRILVVDDDEGILEVVKCVLEMEGYTVITSNDSRPIFTLLNQKPEIILLDVLLSGEDGRDIARKLKSHHDTKDIPVIMMSAHPNAQASTKEAGADAFIPKPFDIDSLLHTVEKYVQKKRAN